MLQRGGLGGGFAYIVAARAGAAQPAAALVALILDDGAVERADVVLVLHVPGQELHLVDHDAVLAVVINVGIADVRGGNARVGIGGGLCGLLADVALVAGGAGLGDAGIGQ